ncbi:DUF2752 domain-containing protein [Aeromicrobium wangtongii]|uniref:DUF2752 domain-containing protein n=1 Tax=Aeromicrobium wangtongii TaxID=2969247 RepID=A0ABY5MAC2_9ACTN|nr:DUF2752 domain-containing protein [Aeromicrobium wangtongii]MCD9197589.1 DUF2752 domain-containing protein [Aeromicrobium wangtongii]UUP15079.1 DUF2752 domain-containing protein [Aeromicrobium wangtongii]
MSTSARARPTSTARALLAPALAGGLGLAAAALLHVRDPHESGSYGFCPFLSLTGLPCPGCGGLRAVNDLTRGDLVAAVSSNALAVVLVLAVGIGWVLWVVRRATGRRRPPITISWWLVAAGALVVAVFGVVRTTAWGSWLAP